MEIFYRYWALLFDIFLFRVGGGPSNKMHVYIVYGLAIHNLLLWYNIESLRHPFRSVHVSRHLCQVGNGSNTTFLLVKLVTHSHTADGLQGSSCTLLLTHLVHLYSYASSSFWGNTQSQEFHIWISIVVFLDGFFLLMTQEVSSHIPKTNFRWKIWKWPTYTVCVILSVNGWLSTCACGLTGDRSRV